MTVLCKSETAYNIDNQYQCLRILASKSPRLPVNYFGVLFIGNLSARGVLTTCTYRVELFKSIDLNVISTNDIMLGVSRPSVDTSGY